jgi:hypothetical protein
MTQDPSTGEPDQGRPEQHGPEMDDTQVEATGALRDELPPVDPGPEEHGSEDDLED